MLKRKVLSVTNPYQDSEQVLELERLLNQGWNIINSIANKYAILYILEKNDNLNEDEIKLKITNEAIKTEMLKEIVKRDRLLRTYKDTTQYLIAQNRPVEHLELDGNFDAINYETEELLSSEVWED